MRILSYVNDISFVCEDTNRPTTAVCAILLCFVLHGWFGGRLYGMASHTCLKLLHKLGLGKKRLSILKALLCCCDGTHQRRMCCTLSIFNTLGARCLACSDVPQSREDGIREVLLHVSCFNCNHMPTHLSLLPSSQAAFLIYCYT